MEKVTTVCSKCGHEGTMDKDSAIDAMIEILRRLKDSNAPQ